MYRTAKKENLEEDFDGLVLPGGESTVQGKLLKELGMFDALKEKIEAGMPVLATCAGLILLAKDLTNDDHRYFATLPVSVRRNAYGRQLGSFHTTEEFEGIGKVPMTFIRVLAKVHHLLFTLPFLHKKIHRTLLYSGSSKKVLTVDP